MYFVQEKANKKEGFKRERVGSLGTEGVRRTGVLAIQQTEYWKEKHSQKEYYHHQQPGRILACRNNSREL